METCALACYTKQQTILAQKHSGTKITLFRPQYAIKVPFEKCRNWCPNVSHKNLSSSKSVHRCIYSCSFQILQWGIWITAGFFFFRLIHQSMLSILFTTPHHFYTPQNKRLLWCSLLCLLLQLKWLHGRWTEFTVQHINDQRPMGLQQQFRSPSYSTLCPTALSV